MKIIIIGAGKVGFTAAKELASEGHDITLIENSGSVLEAALETIDIAGILGSGINSSILEAADVSSSDMLIALTGSDEQNLLSCLIGKRLGAKSTIARIRNPEFSSILPLISEDLGLSLAVNPEKEAALEMTRILEFPIARNIETFAKGKVEMIDCEVVESSPMCNKQVKEVFSSMSAGLVCAVERNGEVYIPLGDFRFEKGDIMTVIAPTGKMSWFFKESGIKSQSVKNVIISGGGKTSIYLANLLLSQKIKVTIIEQNPEKVIELSSSLPNANIVFGDGTSHSLLEEEGILASDSFCCLTGIDEENILTTLYARYVSPKIKTVTKVNRVELIPIISPSMLGSVVSPKLIAADRVVSYVRARSNKRGSGVLTVYKIVNGKAEAIEFEVKEDSPLIGKPISSLSLKDGIILACINRNGKIISPRGNDMLEKNDTVIIVTTLLGLSALDDIVRG